MFIYVHMCIYVYNIHVVCAAAVQSNCACHYVCMYVCMYIYTYVRMYVRVYHVCIYTYRQLTHVYVWCVGRVCCSRASTCVCVWIARTGCAQRSVCVRYADNLYCIRSMSFSDYLFLKI